MTASHTAPLEHIPGRAVPKQILIADDDPTTRMMLRAAITQWGYEVAEAPDGEAAWEILKNSDTPKLLIVDWLMPKIDGVELCARVRKELKFHHYIILLTQLTGAANLIRGLEAGADEFLSKPFNMAELSSRLAVGARVLDFESKINARNRQFEADLSRLIELSINMQTSSSEVNELVKQITNEEQKKLLVQKTNELNIGLNHSSEIIKKLDDMLKI